MRCCAHDHEKIEKYFQGNSEKIAKDAVWATNQIFKIGVIDDGTKRDSYANYVCTTLYEYGFKGKSIWVQIVDIVKLANNGK